MNTRKYSAKQEKKVSKLLNAKVQSNSGATPFYKGDVITNSFLIECKTSVSPKKSQSIKKEWLDKLEEEKFAMNKSHSALLFDYGDDGKLYAIIDAKLFRKLVEVIENEDI